MLKPSEFQGKLVEDNTEVLKAGEYSWHDAIGGYYACTPDGQLANLVNHNVTQNEYGEITVTPSILVSGGEKPWHGYLTEGIWREC